MLNRRPARVTQREAQGLSFSGRHSETCWPLGELWTFTDYAPRPLASIRAGARE